MMARALTIRNSPHLTRRRGGGADGSTNSSYSPSADTKHLPSRPLTPRDVYIAALRCCLISVLDSTGDAKAQQQVKNHGRTSAEVHRHGLASAGLSFADKAAGKLKLHVSDEMSVEADGTIKLVLSTLKRYRKMLVERTKMFAGAGNDLLMGTFAQAASKLLRERYTESSTSMAFFADMRDLVLVIGAYIDKELPAHLSAEDHDKYLFRVMELFMAVLREALQRAEPRNMIISSQLVNDVSSLKAMLRPFIKCVADSDIVSSNLAEWARVVFGVRKEDHAGCVADAKKVCTDKSTLLELKTFLDATIRDSCPYSRPDDFPSRQAYDIWKQRETTTLQGLMQAFLQRFPNAKNLRTSRDNDPTLFLPADPRAYYRLLLETCLQHDLQHSTEKDHPLTLSKPSIALLSECALRWQISKEYKEFALLDLMVKLYHDDYINEEELIPKFNHSLKVVGSWDMWRTVDRTFYVSILEILNEHLFEKLRTFSVMLDWKEKTPKRCNTIMQTINQLLERLREDQAWLSVHPEWQQPGVLEERVRMNLLEAINTRYQQSSDQVSSITEELPRLIASVKSVNSDINTYRLYFRDPILGMSIMLIAAETSLKYFILEMENMRYVLDKGFQLTEMLELYQAVRLLKELCEESDLDIVKSFDVENWFAPFVGEWLQMTDSRWLEWVDNAVKIEDYEPAMAPVSMHSTSVIDMFTCFHAGLEFIEKLAWRESAKKDRLVKDFIKMISKSLQRYTQLMWEEFQQIDNENLDRSVEFSRESCIKMNNIVAAHGKLRSMFKRIVPDIHRPVDPDATRTEPSTSETTYDITIIRATNLQICDWNSSDPYVVLSHNGTELHRTRIIPQNLNPAWNQAYVVSLPAGSEFLDLIVYDHDKIGKDDLCGSTTLLLKDDRLADFLSHDVELSLRPQGVLNVRVRRVGDVDDVVFWARRGEEVLRECLEDMVRVYTEQITRAARQTLTNLTKKALFPLFSSTTGMDVLPQLTPFLTYLDSTFGLLNETLDRRLNIYLSAQSAARKFTRKVIATIADDIEEQEVDQNQPTLLIKHIYTALVSYVLTAVTAMDAPGSSTNTNASGPTTASANSLGPPNLPARGSSLPSAPTLPKETLQTYSTFLESLKALVVCGGSGFKLHEVEKGAYGRVRERLENVAPAD
ncbi:hypothetical protein BC832DRAFT_123334 [Gaertneriomyces semiglobifer]|nr:hypothetical protein BC832DRAFT_123334 [Gaertneriomyces semiglobifer]